MPPGQESGLGPVMDAEIRAGLDDARRHPDSLDKIDAAARRLFIERGYHLTRPQDIAREAGLGHGTFYLHYSDKQACFLAFVDKARCDLSDYIRDHVEPCDTLEQSVSRTLVAICDYTKGSPGMAHAAMVDETMIGAARLLREPHVRQWGQELAQFIRLGVRDGRMADSCIPEILGQAIAGAVYQCWQECDRQGSAPDGVSEQLVHLIRHGLNA